MSLLLLALGVILVLGGVGQRALGAFGALTILVYAMFFIPVLLARAPMMFRIPPIVYLLLSVFILGRTGRSTTSR